MPSPRGPLGARREQGPDPRAGPESEGRAVCLPRSWLSSSSLEPRQTMKQVNGLEWPVWRQGKGALAHLGPSSHRGGSGLARVRVLIYPGVTEKMGMLGRPAVGPRTCLPSPAPPRLREWGSWQDHSRKSALDESLCESPLSLPPREASSQQPDLCP